MWTLLPRDGGEGRGQGGAGADSPEGGRTGAGQVGTTLVWAPSQSLLHHWFLAAIL